jgi:tetratricopeptide (TPR) repeat protein
LIVPRIVLITLLLVLSPWANAAPTTSTADAQIEKLVESLGDPDPAVRQRAGERLTAMGFRARPALVRAAQSGSPQVASRASELLMPMPWWVLNDPPGVRQKLLQYGSLNNNERMSAIGEIAIIPGSESALLRLAHDDPSPTVAWWAASVLTLIDSARIGDSLRKMDLTDARVQIVALAARAFLPLDRPKAVELLRRAIEDDDSDDGTDKAPLAFAYNVLVVDAIERGDVKQAGEVLRARARRIAMNGDASAAVFALFALHADHGPTDEFGDDLEEYSAYLGRPEMVYALSRIAAKTGAHLIHDALSECAAVASLASTDSRERVALLCAAHAWPAEARRELYVVAAAESKPDDPMRVETVRGARRMLAMLAESEENHLAAIEHLQVVLELSAKPTGLIQIDPLEIQAQINTHRLHLAHEAGDRAAADKLVTKVMAHDDPDSDVAIEVFQYLKSAGRDTDAKEYFNRVFAQDEKLLTARIVLPEYSTQRPAERLNNAAWLCARTGQRLDDGLKLINRALSIAPDEYAYLDTAATVHFAAGNRDEAIKLEKRAQILRPNDVFIQRQLERFQEGTKAQRHEGTKGE